MTASDKPLQQTCLHNLHLEQGARMAAFGGFDMPIQYTGIIPEHLAARTGAALFDTCHMGSFRISGPDALSDLELLVSCDVASLPAGRCRYGLMCNEEGGVLDDLLVYRLGDDEFLLVVNASTRRQDAAWIKAHQSPSTQVEDCFSKVAKLDLQGPASPRIMNRLVEGLTDPGYYGFTSVRYHGEEVRISRTGYTGEIGFELYLTPASARRFWREAQALGAVAAGLGARDTLRLEMGMPLYGHELCPTRNAAQTGFTRAIASAKTFSGAYAIRRPDAAPQRLCGIRLGGRRAARHGDTVITAAGQTIGCVTSGSFAPSLGCAIALAYVDSAQATAGTPLQIHTERADLPGQVVTLPFHTGATARRPMADFLGVSTT